jgi:hypothetical protein
MVTAPSTRAFACVSDAFNFGLMYACLHLQLGAIEPGQSPLVSTLLSENLSRSALCSI